MTVSMTGEVIEVRDDVKLVYDEEHDVTKVIDGGEPIRCHRNSRRICNTDCAAFYSEAEYTTDDTGKETCLSYCQCLLLPKWAKWTLL